MLQEFIHKSEYLKTHKYQDLIQKLILVAGDSIVKSSPEIRSGIRKALELDLAYIFFRHQAWVHAPVLTELSIDYINSEFAIPRNDATVIVESCVELLHNYIPIEKGWTAIEYDEEFLFQLFISSASSDGESELKADIGFGDNVLKLLYSAASLDNNSQVNIFAPELTQSLYQMMSDISQEMADTPWIIDLYKLKKIVESRDLHSKHRLTKQDLENSFQIINKIAWLGASFQELQSSFKEIKLKRILDQLIGAEVVYIQGTGRRIKYHLSHIGIDLISQKAADSFSTIKIEDILKAPGPVQIKLLQRPMAELEADIGELSKNASRLDPKALAQLLSRVSKENSGTIDLVLRQLPIAKLNSWAKCELCKALAALPGSVAAESLLESFLRNDASAKVREKARSSLQDWRRTSHIRTGRKEVATYE